MRLPPLRHGMLEHYATCQAVRDATRCKRARSPRERCFDFPRFVGSTIELCDQL